MAETSFPRDRIRITLLENAHPAAAAALTERGYSVEVIPRALEGDELREVMAASHVLGVRSRTKVRDEHLAHAGRMLAIGCFSVGTDQVAIDDAARRGIPVFNAPYASTRSVAELTMGCVVAPGPAPRRQEQRAAPAPVGQVAGRCPRGARPHHRHRRLRPHRPAGGPARRGVRHARALPRHRQEAGPRPGPADRRPRRPARGIGLRHAPRARDAAHRGDDRQGAARPHAPGELPAEPVARQGGGRRGAARGAAAAATSAAPPSTSTGRSRRPRWRSSTSASPICPT